MSSPVARTGASPPVVGPQTIAFALAALVAVAVGLGLVAMEKPGLAVLVLLVLPALPALRALVRSPDFVPPLIAFVLYLNAPVVAVNFHGAPMLIAAAVPLLLLLPAARDVLLHGKQLVITPVLGLLLLFLLIQFAGALFALYPEESVLGMMEDGVEALMLYVLLTNAIRTPRTLKQVIWAMILAGALLGGLALHQQLTGAFDDSYGGFSQVSGNALRIGGGEATQPRLSGPIGEKNRFAQIMAMLIPLALLQAFTARSRWQALAAAGCLGFIFIGFALAFSRGAAVAVALMVGVMTAMGYMKLRYIAITALVGVLALGAVPQYAVRVGSLFELAEKTMSQGGIKNADGATRGRMTEMVASAMVFADHPLIGVGPGMNRYHYIEYARIAGGKVKSVTRRAHSLYLGLAAEHGVLGLVVFFGMIALTMRDLRRARGRWIEEHPELAAIADSLVLALVVYLTTSIFLHAAYIRYFWLVMGIAGAASYLQVPSKADDIVRWMTRRFARPA